MLSRLREGEEFDGLRHFFAAYFHQTGDLDHEDEDDVIQVYVAEARPAGVAELRCEMDKLLAVGFSDVDLRKALGVVDIKYRPPAEASAGLRTWRTKVFTEANRRLSVQERSGA